MRLQERRTNRGTFWFVRLLVVAAANYPLHNNDFFFELVVATREALSKQTGTKKGNAIDYLPVHPFIIVAIYLNNKTNVSIAYCVRHCLCPLQPAS